MSERKFLRLPLAAAALIACASAHAEYQTPDGKFRLSGFGTLGAVVTDTDDVHFSYDERQQGGATTRPSMEVDSKVALQGTYQFTPKVSATSQIMLKQNTEGQYEPNVEWAFAKWQVLPSVSVRVGRTGAPLFMISDFRDVGYANTFVRPPADVYDQVPFSTVDGGDISVQHTIGPVTLTAQLWGGNSKNSFYRDGIGSTEAQFNNLLGLNLIAEIDGGVTLRAGRVDTKLTFNNDSLPRLKAGATSAAGLLTLAGQTAAAAQYAGIVPFATVEDANASFSGIGMSIDRNNWVGSFEYTKRKADSFVSDSTGWYAMVGYRVGTFTPFVGVSKVKMDRVGTNPVSGTAAATLSAVAAGAVGANQMTAAQAAQLNSIKGGVDALLEPQDYGQRTATMGVRWDVARNIDLKGQWDRITTSGGRGLFNSPTADFEPGKAVNVFSVAMDFVF